jgi:hypothetical protein
MKAYVSKVSEKDEIVMLKDEHIHRMIRRKCVVCASAYCHKMSNLNKAFFESFFPPPLSQFSFSFLSLSLTPALTAHSRTHRSKLLAIKF